MLSDTRQAMNFITWQKRETSTKETLMSPFLVKDQIMGGEGNESALTKNLLDGLCAWDIREFKLAAR